MNEKHPSCRYRFKSAGNYRDPVRPAPGQSQGECRARDYDTAGKRERIYSDLLGGGGGRYHEYISEYGIDPASIDFGHHNIHVITDEHGIELPDIASEYGNERLLEKCLKLSFRFTRDPDCALFFSVAGGRKTMSSCLTLAAQIYGRPQDRLYHLLISPEFESNRDFYYPPKQSKSIELRDVKG